MADVSECSDNDPSIPLIVRLRRHANDLNGDGCWRVLLNEAADELEQPDEAVRDGLG